MIKSGPAYDQRNEFEHREGVERELANTYRKNQDIIIPYGKKLGFNGTNGEQVVLSYDEAFKITIDGTTVVELATDSALTTVEGKLSASYGVTVDANGRIASLKLLSNGDTSDIVFTADSLKFYDGRSEVALFSAGGGVVTVNGDLGVSGRILTGTARWPVALAPRVFRAADGEAIEWAGGAALGAVPTFTVQPPAGVALAAGEAWQSLTVTSATTTGGTVYVKIATPATPSTVTSSTDSAGGGGSPDRIMNKTDSADAYDAIYAFRVQGTMTITSTYESELAAYLHTGGAYITTYFNDGGGWDAGPAIIVTVEDVLGATYSASDETGSHAYDVTQSVTWASAIGQHGAEEFGATIAAGGTLTDLTSVVYQKMAATGTRTGSPNGEKATITVIPANS